MTQNEKIAVNWGRVLCDCLCHKDPEVHKEVNKTAYSINFLLSADVLLLLLLLLL
jgi:hypothetical protein